jgi:hypothetical protein
VNGLHANHYVARMWRRLQPCEPYVAQGFSPAGASRTKVLLHMATRLKFRSTWQPGLKSRFTSL